MLALSGGGALVCEVVWMRRLALLTGSSALAVTATLALYMGGLGLGSLAASRVRGWRAPRGYGLLELSAAAWAISVPALLGVVAPLTIGGPAARLAAATLILLPPALLHGATLPALAPVLRASRDTGRLYAANTAGAVVGVLVGTFFLLPLLGVRGAELVGAACSATAGAWALTRPEAASDARPRVQSPPPLDWAALLAAGVAGATGMALEVAWSRLAALLLGGSVYAFALVLATFLFGIAVGARVGRARGRAALGPALLVLACAAVGSTLFWRGLPHALGLLWSVTGPELWMPAAAGVLGLTFLAAPVASGAAFTAALDQPGAPTRVSGAVLAANTVGSVLGSVATGLWLLPAIGLRSAVCLAGAWSLAAGVALLAREGRPRWPTAAAGVGAATLLFVLSPAWDPALYAVGVGLRVHEFADVSPRAVERFAHDGWALRYYTDGQSASVAVGQSTRTGNLWLSLNGKVDASTGDDMPTQVLSGALPLHLLRARDPDRPLHAGVVGLASGITAHAALEAGANRVTVIELEPAVVEAAAFFSEHNGDLLHDDRAEVVVDDARAVFRRPGPAFDALISEPSNPWITGVSNLFTEEYWRLGRARLRPGGVFVQWVQLYALPPDALRGLVRSFQTVFDDVWLFETIPGADAVLIGTTPGARILPAEVAQLPLRPVLDPAGCRRLAGRARRNTDDHPWVEFAAPRWLHRQTNRENAALIQAAARD